MSGCRPHFTAAGSRDRSALAGDVRVPAEPGLRHTRGRTADGVAVSTGGATGAWLARPLAATKLGRGVS